MFDRLYDASGNEWQTKAYSCILASYYLGDEVPGDGPFAHQKHQVEVLGGPHNAPAVDSYATIRHGRLDAVPTERDEDLPLLDYSGGWISAGKEA